MQYIYGVLPPEVIVIAFGKSGGNFATRLITFYIELLVLVAIVGGTGAGIYTQIGYYSTNASAFGLAGLWTVGGVLYILLAYGFFMVLVKMVEQLVGHKII